MKDIFNKFKINVINGSVKRVQMDDATYFGPEYKNHVSNSKLGLLNPAQGGSPQKFLEGFKSSGSQAFALGSAVHQLTLEPNDYVLSDFTKPSGKLGKMYELFCENLEKANLMELLQTCKDSEEPFSKFMDIVEENKEVEKALVLACIDADYYAKDVENFKGTDLPSKLKTGLSKAFAFFIAEKPSKIDGKSVIYLPNDLYSKCKSCASSLAIDSDIQKALRWPLSYCEDVILAELEISFPEDFNDEFSKMITTIVPVKIKIDNWTIDHERKHFVLNDLKTTGKPIQYFMGRTEMELGFMGEQKEVFVNGSWQNFHYHRQMGMYLFLLREYINQEYGTGYDCTANMLVVETIGAFNSKIFSVSNEEIVAGFKDFTDLIKRAAYHQVRGYENILEFEKANSFDDLSLSI